MTNDCSSIPTTPWPPARAASFYKYVGFLQVPTKKSTIPHPRQTPNLRVTLNPEPLNPNDPKMILLEPIWCKIDPGDDVQAPLA